MGKGRRGVSAGTWIMLVLTAAVILAAALFLSQIVGEDIYSKTGHLLTQLTHRESQTAAPQMETTPAPHIENRPRSVQKISVSPCTPTPVPQVVSFTLAAAGTVYAPKAVRQSALNSAGHYDFSELFKGVGSLLEDADLSIVTLETTLAGEEKGYGNYNTAAQILDALRGLGVDMASLATEHALDKGYEGLDITLNELTSRGMAYAGIASESVKSVRIGGVQVAFIACTYGLSDEGREKTKDDARGVISMLETEYVRGEIAAVRADGANVVVVLPHWGTKNKQETPDNVRAMARTLAQAGADIILGTHPNVVQGIERLNVTRTDGLDYEAVVCYSLGSLLTDARTAENTAGMVLDINISYNPVTRRTALGTPHVTPLYIACQREGSSNVYRVVNAQDEAALAVLEESQRAAARAAAQLVAEVTAQ